MAFVYISVYVSSECRSFFDGLFGVNAVTIYLFSIWGEHRQTLETQLSKYSGAPDAQIYTHTHTRCSHRNGIGYSKLSKPIWLFCMDSFQYDRSSTIISSFSFSSSFILLATLYVFVFNISKLNIFVFTVVLYCQWPSLHFAMFHDQFVPMWWLFAFIFLAAFLKIIFPFHILVNIWVMSYVSPWLLLKSFIEPF